MALEKIILNLIPTGETPTIHAAQFDKERGFQIELKEGEDDFSPTGYDIELQVRKVDNNIVTVVPSQVSSNIVTFLTTEQMTACSGTNLAELQISKNKMSIATLHFYLVVQRDVLAGGLSSQSDIYNLEEQIAAIVPEVIGDEYYTADQVDEKIAEIPTFDPTNYYDKTETNGLLSQKANTSSLSTVAFTGSYDDLVDHPVIPDVSDYYTKEETYSQNEVNTLLLTKADISSLSTVATSGSYDDLSDKPTIPGNASVLPISASDPTNTKEYIDNKTTLVKSASGSLVHITDGADNIPVKACNITIAPDLNGHTEANLVVCGKNMWPKVSSTTDSGIIYSVDSNGIITASGQATAGSRIGRIFYLPAGNYILSGASENSSLGNGDIYVSRASDGVVIARDFTSAGINAPKFTLTEYTRVYLGIRFSSNATVSSSIKVFKPQIEVGNIVTEFEPYNATTYNIPFGQTITTGGTLDVITGILTVGGVETQITPVSPKTISGVNNIYNDCGDTAIEYFTSSADDIADLIRALM